MRRALLLVTLCAACLVSCARAPAYQVPELTDDGWEVASLDDVEMDADLLSRAVARIANGTYENVHAVLIVKNGTLVFERYFPGYTWAYEDARHQGDRVTFDRDIAHNLASVTKSVTSILVGIALDQGRIGSVDDKVFAYFPQYAHLNDAETDTLALEHLLTMSSGLQWNENELPYSNSNNDLVRLFSEPDPVDYILSRPIVSEPGTEFYYGGDNTNLLGEVIRSATGHRMDAFAEDVLFGPLGIADYAWDFINDDMVHASGNLRLRPRDMAKLGQLCLNGGEWDGRRIVSEAWITESTREHVTRSVATGYGYQWWLRTYHLGSNSVDAFTAAGWGGQWIIVIPDLDMVVVFTGGNYVSEDPSTEILTDYILPAVHRPN